MSTTGRVVDVSSPNTGSASLLSDVTSSATVLPVDDAAMFAEDFSVPRFLVIGSETTPREYVAVQNDEDDPAGESVTLAAAVGGSGFEADLPVTPWDPYAPADDKRAVEFRVSVLPDGAEFPVSVVVPHEWLPTSGDTAALLGARVRIEETLDDEWSVSGVLGRQAVVSQSVIDAPAFSMRLAADQTIVSDTDTVLTNWEGEDGTTDNGGDTSGAPSGGGGYYRSTARTFRWAV